MKKIVCTVFSQVFVACLCCLPTFALEETYDLIHEVDSTTTLNILTQLQHTGSVIVDSAGTEEDARVLPMEVRAKLQFDQRFSSEESSAPQSIRKYTEASATIEAGKGATSTTLDKENSLVLARMKNEENGNSQFQIASIENALSQKEYELLKTPGDTLVFGDLFNKKDVKVGDKWQPDRDVVAQLAAINRLISNGVSSMLKSVDGDEAKIYIYGRLKGEVDDAITDMNIKAIALLDMKKKMVTSFRMTIDEERRAGQVAPGFEGKIKVDSRITVAKDNPLISKSRLANIYKGKKVKFSFLLNRKDSDFEVNHDPNWRVIATEKEAAVMRLINDGQLIGQCNIVQLPDRPTNSLLSLADFEKEIQRITSQSESRIESTNQFVTRQGHSALNVVVDGVEQGIPFSWIYYHVGADDGRRVTFVFTVEKDLADYFDSADKKLVDNLDFKPQRTAGNSKALPKRK